MRFTWYINSRACSHLNTTCAVNVTVTEATSCPLDVGNDADSDNICGDVDSCAYDTENDADADLICGDRDSCPLDAGNDADSDNICGGEDSCPY